MKYLITESQALRLRFVRRVHMSPREYVMLNISYMKDICRFGSFGVFMQRLLDELPQDWMEYEDLDYIVDFANGEMYNELRRLYKEKCIYI